MEQRLFKLNTPGWERPLSYKLNPANDEKRALVESITDFKDLREQYDFDSLIGSGKKLFDILKTSAKISATNASVIILGESGTGKDLLARSIHSNSLRREKPFVTIDCSSIPADLLESELFGYETGAFTGAVKVKPGKLEIADGGTVFFDEIGEMSLNLQAKLLRVLQTKEIERLGSIQTKKIDIRVICATNKNIPAMVSNRQFREDLYYRLKVIELMLPALRERKEDIEELIQHFLKKHAEEDKKYFITQDAIDILEEYTWHGNIRELENVILRCVILAKENVIDVQDLPQEIVEKTGGYLSGMHIKHGKTLLDAEEEFRRTYVIKTLRKTSSKAEAAKLLGINRTHFYKLLSRLGIES